MMEKWILLRTLIKVDEENNIEREDTIQSASGIDAEFKKILLDNYGIDLEKVREQ